MCSWVRNSCWSQMAVLIKDIFLLIQMQPIPVSEKNISECFLEASVNAIDKLTKIKTNHYMVLNK